MSSSIIYSDSDFVGDRELTKNSRSGGMITLNLVPISWSSTPQPKTVYSPAAAEIYALREMAREGQGINWVCRDLGMGGCPHLSACRWIMRKWRPLSRTPACGRNILG